MGLPQFVQKDSFGAGGGGVGIGTVRVDWANGDGGGTGVPAIGTVMSIPQSGHFDVFPANSSLTVKVRGQYGFGQEKVIGMGSSKKLRKKTASGETTLKERGKRQVTSHSVSPHITEACAHQAHNVNDLWDRQHRNGYKFRA
jgi:hypothetical protein